MELTLYTGLAGDVTTIHIDWFDENNVHQQNDLEIQILPQDKPRTLAIVLDTKVLVNIDAAGMTRN